jgi:hypothetical protein
MDWTFSNVSFSKKKDEKHKTPSTPVFEDGYTNDIKQRGSKALKPTTLSVCEKSTGYLSHWRINSANDLNQSTDNISNESCGRNSSEENSPISKISKDNRQLKSATKYSEDGTASKRLNSSTLDFSTTQDQSPQDLVGSVLYKDRRFEYVPVTASQELLVFACNQLTTSLEISVNIETKERSPVSRQKLSIKDLLHDHVK